MFLFANESLSCPLMLSWGQSSLLLRCKLLIEPFIWCRLSFKNLHWYRQFRNTPSCPAPSGLTEGCKKAQKLKFSPNGLPGGPVVEPHRGASSSALCIPLPLASPHHSVLTMCSGNYGFSALMEFLYTQKLQYENVDVVISEDPAVSQRNPGMKIVTHLEKELACQQKWSLNK